MAVTLTTDDLIQPIGELAASLFPASDMDDMLSGWLAIAIEKVEADSRIDSTNHDAAAAAYVYYRAYDYIANQMATMPNSASEGDGAISVSISDARVAHYRTLANSKLLLYGGWRSVNSAVGTHFTLAHGQRGR